MIDKYEFDEGTHTAKINGIIVPTISQVLTETGYCSYEKISLRKRKKSLNFGKAFHLAAELDDNDNLGSCDEKLLPYVEQYRKFKKNFKLDFFDINEERFYSKRLMFSGQPDKFHRGKNILFELKTGEPADWHRFQTAGQEILILERFPGLKIKQRWAVYFKEKTYSIKVHNLKTDKQEFLKILSDCHAKRG